MSRTADSLTPGIFGWRENGYKPRKARSAGTPGTARPQPAQPLDERRVVRERGGTVEKRVEHLVVPRGGQLEPVPDGLLLGTRVPPPLLLEVQDVALALGQLARRRLSGPGRFLPRPVR